MIYNQAGDIFFSVATQMSSSRSGTVNNWHPESGSVIQDYGSKDLDPDSKKTFTDPQQRIDPFYISRFEEIFYILKDLLPVGNMFFSGHTNVLARSE